MADIAASVLAKLKNKAKASGISCEPHHPSVNAMDGASGGLGPRLMTLSKGGTYHWVPSLFTSIFLLFRSTAQTVVPELYP